SALMLIARLPLVGPHTQFGLIGSPSLFVVPAQAGTHIPEPVVMGPRLRGDDSYKSWIISRSRSRRLHALRLEHLGGSRARQGLEQSLGGVALLGVGADAGGIDGVVLDLRRQRTHERDAFHRQDFADLVNAELRLALGHVLRHRAARDQFGLGLYFSGDPELVEQAGDVD